MDGDIYPLLNQFRRAFGKYEEKLALFQALIREGFKNQTAARKITLILIRQAAHVLEFWDDRTGRDLSFLWWTRKLLSVLAKKLPEIGLREMILSHLHSLDPASVLIVDILKYSSHAPEWFLEDLCQFGSELSKSLNLRTLPKRTKDITAMLALASLLPQDAMIQAAGALKLAKKLPKSSEISNEARNLLFEIRYELKRIEVFRRLSPEEKFAYYLKDLTLEIPQMRWERLPDQQFIDSAVRNARDLVIMQYRYPDLAEKIRSTLFELTAETHSMLERIAATFGILEFVDPPLPDEKESEISERTRGEISLLALTVHDEALREVLSEVYEVIT